MYLLKYFEVFKNISCVIVEFLPKNIDCLSEKNYNFTVMSSLNVDKISSWYKRHKIETV